MDRLITIHERLKLAHQQLQKFSMTTEVIEIKIGEHAIARVTVTTDGCTFQGLGVSLAALEKKHMARWSVALAETRARHRALAAAGVAPDIYGAEEVDAQEDADETQYHAKSAAAAPAPASNGTGRAACGKALMELGRGDKEAARALLGAILPGRTSIAGLGDDDVGRLTLALAIVHGCGGSVASGKEWTKTQWGLPWVDVMTPAQRALAEQKLAQMKVPHAPDYGEPPF